LDVGWFVGLFFLGGGKGLGGVSEGRRTSGEGRRATAADGGRERRSRVCGGVSCLRDATPTSSIDGLRLDQSLVMGERGAASKEGGGRTARLPKLLQERERDSLLSAPADEREREDARGRSSCGARSAELAREYSSCRARAWLPRLLMIRERGG
jgi:hypothetical protein